MTESQQDKWNRAVDTLASMCLSDKMGSGPSKMAFIFTLRLYAQEMERLLQPEEAEAPVCQSEGKEPEDIQ